MSTEQTKTVKQMVEWVLQGGFKRIGIILPLIPFAMPLSSRASAQAILQVRDELRHQRNLGQLLAAALLSLPGELCPYVRVGVDNPTKGRLFIEPDGQMRFDLIISIHPCRPPIELQTMQCTVQLREECPI